MENEHLQRSVIAFARGGVSAFFSFRDIQELDKILNVSYKVTVMPVNTQFSIAVHLMAGLGYAKDCDMTSAYLAKSINTSPSFVRRVLAKLSKANLVSTTMGKTGSCSLAKKPADISLLDIYKAVDAPKAFAIHDYPEQKSCAVSCSIKAVIGGVLDKTQGSMEKSLDQISLADVIKDLPG